MKKVSGAAGTCSPVRPEVFREFGRPGTDGFRRQEIRNTIQQLSKEEPAILNAYGPDLEQLLPGITAGVDLSSPGFAQP